MRASVALAAVLATAAHDACADRTAPARIPQKALELAERGRALHDAGNYAAAIEAFEHAYALAPSPGLLFNIAQSYRLGGDCDDAAWMYRRFLETHPSVDRRAIAEVHLRAVEKCGHGGLHLAIEPPPPIEGNVPEPFVEAPADPPGQHVKQAGVGLAIGGGLALAGAAFFALDASEAADTVSQMYAKGGTWHDAADTDARGRRSAMAAAVLGLTGAAALAAGAACYWFGVRREHSQHVAVMPTTRGAEVSWTWGF